MKKTADAIGFLIKAPFILLFLVAVNWMTGGDWWVQWPALGLGLAWVFCLLHVIRTVLFAGGLAAVAAYLASRR